MQVTEKVFDNVLDPRRQRFKRGWAWVYSAFELYLRAPLLWTLIALLVVLVCLTATVVLSWLGVFLGMGLLPLLLLPLLFSVFLGSIMQLAKKADEGTPPEVMAIFSPFSVPQELAKIGLFYLTGTAVVIMLLVAFMLGSIKLGWTPEITPELFKVHGLRSMWPFLLMFFTSFSMVCSACFFAPALVVLHGISARDAMRWSFVGFWRNWLPVLIWFFATVFMLAVAAIPFFLGLLVAVPVMLISFYTSYVDIYEN